MAMLKTCFKCSKAKPFADFYRHSAMADGHLGKCKECAKADVKINRSSKIEYYRALEKARSKLPKAIADRAAYQKTDAGKVSHKKATQKWRAEHPQRMRAQGLISDALRNGRMQKQPCFICGDKAHAHHPDYDRPLDVMWLCPKHHKETHLLTKECK